MSLFNENASTEITIDEAYQPTATHLNCLSTLLFALSHGLISSEDFKTGAKVWRMLSDLGTLRSTKLEALELAADGEIERAAIMGVSFLVKLGKIVTLVFEKKVWNFWISLFGIGWNELIEQNGCAADLVFAKSIVKETFDGLIRELGADPDVIRPMFAALGPVGMLVYCPLDITVTDDTGRIIVIPADSQDIVNQIDSSYAVRYGDFKCIFLPDGFTYSVELLAKDSGCFGFTLYTLDEDSSLIGIEYEDVHCMPDDRFGVTGIETSRIQNVFQADTSNDGSFDFVVEPGYRFSFTAGDTLGDIQVNALFYEEGLNGLCVVLRDSARVPYGSGTTDSSGTCRFPDLSPGMYQICISSTELYSISDTLKVIQLTNGMHLEVSFYFDMLTAVEDDDVPILPLEFSLDQNYPNPFNPVTEISFSLPKTSEVTLEIFNLLGQSVAKVYQGRLEAGTHSYIWDGSSAASGIYLYRLTAGDFMETKKMILLK
jgi:hypothetical protein